MGQPGAIEGLGPLMTTIVLLLVFIGNGYPTVTTIDFGINLDACEKAAQDLRTDLKIDTWVKDYPSITITKCVERQVL